MTRFTDYLAGSLSGMLLGVLLVVAVIDTRPFGWSAPRPAAQADLSPGRMTTEAPSPSLGSARRPEAPIDPRFAIQASGVSPMPAADDPSPAAAGTIPSVKGDIRGNVRCTGPGVDAPRSGTGPLRCRGSSGQDIGNILVCAAGLARSASCPSRSMGWLHERQGTAGRSGGVSEAISVAVIISGFATWFRSPVGVSAAGPALRAALGPGWRGTRVRVCTATACVVTVLGDFMRADRLIDLHAPLFARLAPLSVGVLRVTVTPIPAPPETSTP